MVEINWKEVARLRTLNNGGGDYHEDDSCLASIPGTPGPFKWDDLNELSTPLTRPPKRTTKNEYEAALFGAFQREKDKDIIIQTLTTENQTALQLTKQREDEIQGLQMRLKFREGAIKRLEAVASWKISSETHLLKEKEEYLKEIELLRTEVACNPEVTRFAMENLRVKEEIRSLRRNFSIENASDASSMCTSLGSVPLEKVLTVVYQPQPQPQRSL